MPSLTTTLVCIIAAFVITLFVCRFIKAGMGASDPAEELEALQAKRDTREDEWIADLEASCKYLRKSLMRTQNAEERKSLQDSIAQAENCLAFLRGRRDAKTPLQLHENAASFLEGRM